MNVRRLVDATLARSPAQPLLRRRARGRLTVLAYHAVDDPDVFERQLDHLAARWHPVSLDAVLAAAPGGPHRVAGGELPERSVLVTFDDGDRSVLEHALPRLRERSIPALAFVVAGLVDGDTPPWWIEAEDLAAAGGSCGVLPGSRGRRLVAALKELSDGDRRRALDQLGASASGPVPRRQQLRAEDLRTLEAGAVEVGNHTLGHPCIPRCPEDVVVAELRDAHLRLTSALGHPPRAFAYPYGDLDPRAEPVLADLGYRAAFLFDHRAQELPVREPLRISRVRVNSDTNLDRFRILLSGLHPALHRALGRD